MQPYIANVEVDLRALIKYESDINAQLNQSQQGPVEKAIIQWGVRYRSFVQLRFDKYSKGSGNWKPLALSTILSRRKGPNTAKVRARKILKLQKKISILKANNKTGKARIPTGKPNPQASSRKSKPDKSKEKIHSLNNMISKLSKVQRVTILRDTGLLFMALTPVFTARPGSLQQRIPFGIRVGYGGPSKHSKSSVSIADIAEIHNLGLGNVPQREIIVAPESSVLAKMALDMERGLKKLGGIE